MKVEEAIKKLSVYSTTKGSGQCTDDEHQEAKKMAISALEKQKARKVIWQFINRDFNTNNYKCFCPTCNKKLKPYEHLCECGQKLEWSKS